MTRRDDGMGSDRSFEEEWPELSRRVRNSLTARGASSWVRDDIIQETALRLFRMWDQVDVQRSPSGLALTIAHNLLWDEQHRKAPGEVLGLIPDVPGSHDVERSGIAREELGRVYRLLPRLKSSQRSVLLAEIGGPEPAISSGDALKMLRMRARRKLTALMESASAGIFVMGFELRRFGWRVSSGVRRHAIPAELPAGAVVAFCGVVAVLMVPLQATTAPSSEGETSGSESRSFAPRFAVEDRPASGPGVAEAVSGRSRVRDSAHKGAAGDPGNGYHLYVGDEGPVNGEAGLQFLPKEDGQGLAPPECGTERPRYTEIVVACNVHAPDRDVKLEVRVAARP
ncbi:MAG TPA: RNA polymerase sigma factor [Actinomycetota bacterium]|nr:RNA polymerase sigma factor [Actinomycetota bacterium]